MKRETNVYTKLRNHYLTKRECLIGAKMQINLMTTTANMAPILHINTNINVNRTRHSFPNGEFKYITESVIQKQLLFLKYKNYQEDKVSSE